MITAAVVMFAALEKPVAYAAFFFASASLLWKAVGVNWVPVLGDAWDTVFESPQGDDKVLPQYPRRRGGDEELWHVIYLTMYGVLGTAAQYGGLLISASSTPSLRKYRLSVVFWCRLYAFFHFTIGCHHILWSLRLRDYGKLELWRYKLPLIYELTGLTALGLLYHASCITISTLKMSTDTTTVKENVSSGINVGDIREVRHRKAVMDTCTCTTFISFIVFLVTNMLGFKTSFETERILWAVTMYPVPLVLLLGFVL